ncbi:hypothetical protein MKQ70_26215 [Chitinophaga sedimenti]|uniref:hypothetical protein n=1 Tax=Chitinophaga sedimenti TaxID=2033606 RepID=UPI0020034CA5|nr:hypothetical protein [Chitinophaga sedimenti]MCK7558307.1 hypothetical protein [Chitinophaga sedimenti]
MTAKQQERIEQVLRDNKLSVTDTRIKMLEMFMQSKNALEHASFEKLNGKAFDRVTIYRTLQTFWIKASCIKYRPRILLCGMHCANRTVRSTSITIIMCTSSARNAVAPPAWMKRMFPILNSPADLRRIT